MNGNHKHIGRIRQTFIYLGKLVRMFIFQNDWKVLPMAAAIAGLVSMAIGKGLFTTMEGTLQGALAMSCVCIWNGFFNSIQSICRERPILKREHRAGLHISSYLAAHLIYQMLLCILQVIIMIYVCAHTGVIFPEKGVISDAFIPELFITLFLLTYASDVLALAVSAVVRNTTAAMTVMPFLLIVQLVFAGFFSMPSSLSGVSDLMITSHGIEGLCTIGRYNELPAVVIWNRAVAAGNTSIGGLFTVQDVLRLVEDYGAKDLVLSKLGEASRNPAYASTPDNLLSCWGYLICFVSIYAIFALIFLEFIDRDQR